MSVAAPHHRRPARPETVRQVVLFVLALALIYPLLWLVFASLRPEALIFSDPTGLPLPPTGENYIKGWTGTGQSFGLYIVNSIILCGVSVIGNVLACSMVGYVFARLDFPFRKTLFALMLATIMLPHQVTLIPQYTLFRELGWVDTYLPMIVPKFLAVDAFFVFLIVQFVRSIPRELDEAALIDGCGPFATYWRIIFPLLLPALVTTAIFTFLWTYDDFFSQLIYITSPEKFTVPLGLRVFLDTTGESAYGAMLAMSVVALVPAVAFFLIFQKRIVDGVATSGLKG
ncbi:carbohydrate ABC transporter membrane protein 2, CUT1 family (TC 3.A.1.1.-) [Devosia enhydra]|uniref:Carbohydrate ABC transporter membrane protein 2, CUT1 family (TC 3.A.1.1.-) n=1 Tax=Devosia enhydra TaxID=665118 RepID=A0A1K2HZR5_9HYPH|nr:carbohydrate ABC transporter permease [Devosia enhydra]SFZ85511.1 carbohydrate ABC transporter membrane protein 2, CUT1 family (TC 3.A.1.1.-) [Devosia enhydra]